VLEVPEFLVGQQIVSEPVKVISTLWNVFQFEDVFGGFGGFDPSFFKKIKMM